MKRSWIGFFLLLVLLAAGMGSTWAMDRIHAPVAGQLRQAAAEAAAEHWEDAAEALDRAKAQWKKWEHFRACFVDHGPAEEITAGLEALTVFCEAREKTAFRGACLELAKQVEALGEAHGIYWWNLL